MQEAVREVLELLDEALEKAQEQKSQSEKNIKTRHWAVVYTELEKVSAYVQTYLEDK